jgi:glycosyltransferase involved in cell wall biosynthesis
MSLRKKKHKKIAICGDFIGKKITGIQRVAYEIMKELDKIAAKDELIIVVPGNIADIPKYKNIEVVLIHGDNGNRHFWIQYWYALYLIKNDMIGLTLCNETPILKPGIAYIHDIYYKLYPENFKSLYDKLSRLFVLCIYHCIIKKGLHIITVSETAKKEIIETYRVEESRISVLGNGWQHILDIVPDESFFEKYNDIEKGQYYFTLGSIGQRKNIKWILEYAKTHGEEIFVLSGKAPTDNFTTLENVKYLGYLEDAQIVVLYKYCKALVFPSLYEGFGLPPLEAMAVGTKSIVSDIPCFREVYEDSVYYIDPYDTNIELSDVLKSTEISSFDKILCKYSWRNVAYGLHNIIEKFTIENEKQ